jgi:hypothetical protein
MVTERDLLILRALLAYAVLSRPQIQRLFFPDDKDGRIARRRLQQLVDHKLINRQQMLYCQPSGGTPAAVYFLSTQGYEYLSQSSDLPPFNPIPVIPHHIPHWIALGETHLVFDTAIAAQTDVQLEGWINEYDVVNKDETAPERRFRLYSLLRDTPRLVCNPDAAFLLSLGQYKKVFYIEQDRATSGANQVADSKHKGYVALNAAEMHRKHFPATNVKTFTVLVVAPHPKRRDALRSAFKDKPGADLWRFTTVDDLQPDRVLHEPIFYPCVGEPGSLIKKKEG